MTNNKQPFKLLEIPLSKFKNEAVPYHQEIFERHKKTTYQLVSVFNGKQLERNIPTHKRTVQQLRSLMYELDTLRTQVEDSDLDKFDSVTLSLRKEILAMISGYTDLEKKALSVISAQIDNENVNNVNHCYENPLAGVSQIMVQEDITELKLTETKNVLYEVEKLNTDIQELNEIYYNLNNLVKEQGENVNQVENQIDTSHANISNGLRHLIKAAKLNKITYPVTGALIGGVIGGPIGLLGGLKIGGLAAIGCGLMGYTGGKIVNKCNQKTVAETEEQLSNNAVDIEVPNKKNI